MDRKSLGSWGEDKAANYLRRKGYKILERNFSCRFGEIDLIASRCGYLAFVEVKLRKDAAFAQAREFVDRGKQRRIITAAELWLSCHDTDLQPRFDVIELYAPEGEKSRRIEINHIQDAFQ